MPRFQKSFHRLNVPNDLLLSSHKRSVQNILHYWFRMITFLLQSWAWRYFVVKDSVVVLQKFCFSALLLIVAKIFFEVCVWKR